MNKKELEKELTQMSEQYSKISTEDLVQRKNELEECVKICFRNSDIFGVYYQYNLVRRELELRNNDLENLKLLAEHSPIAKQILKTGSYRVIPLFTYSNDYLDKDTSDEQQFAFHPNGKCGCINLNDKEVFNIRCNHLMWSDGYIERYEPFFTKFDFNDDKPITNIEELNCVLCYGNHKGEFRMVLITHSI